MRATGGAAVPLGGVPPAFDTEDASKVLDGIFTPEAIHRIQDAIERVAGPSRSPVLLAVATLGMLEFTENMLCSLDAVGVSGRALVVGLESGLCSELSEGRSCVDLTPNVAGLDGRAAFAYSSSAFRAVGLSKLGVATAVVLGNRTRGVLFADVDVAFLRDPLAAADAMASSGRLDAVFQLNNALRAGARTCADFHPKYEEQGGRWRIDVNSGLYYIRDTPDAAHLMTEAFGLLRAGNAGGDGMDQGALWTAISNLNSSLRVDTFPCGEFANGNVFWGHHGAIQATQTVAVHANWMVGSFQKEACMHAAQIWFLSQQYQLPDGRTNGSQRQSRCTDGSGGSVRLAAAAADIGMAAQVDASGRVTCREGGPEDGRSTPKRFRLR